MIKHRHLEPLYLHKLVWFRNHTELHELLVASRPRDTTGRVTDPHPQLEQFFRGVTPLLLAVQLGYHECIEVLLLAGADTLARTEMGFSVMQEATSLGNRDLIKRIASIRAGQIQRLVVQGSDRMKELLEGEIPDFYIEFKWMFFSWIPFVSKYCPYDKCRLWKQGTSIRLDTTLYGMERFKWKRSNISYLVNFDKGARMPRLFVVDHSKGIWEEIDSGKIPNDDSLEELVNVQLNMEILATTIASKTGGDIKVKEAKGGFLFKNQLVDCIKGIDVEGYKADRVTVFTRIRTEHLKDAGKQPEESGVTVKLLTSPSITKVSKLKSKPPTTSTQSSPLASPDFNVDQLSHNFESVLTSPIQSPSPPLSSSSATATITTSTKKKSSLSSEIEEAKSKLKSFTPSLPPPPTCSVSLENYFMENLEDPFSLPYLHVGRPLHMQIKKKTVDIEFFMAPKYPLQLSHLIPILNLIAPGSERMAKLINFLSMEFPPGFPIKIEIPIFMALKACVKFANFKHVQQGIDQFYDRKGNALQVEIHGLDKDQLVYVPTNRNEWFCVPRTYKESVVLKNLLSD